MSKKHTIEFIRAEFEKEGYTLLTKIYENAKQKLEYICFKGHKHVVDWNHWKLGVRCPYCYGNIKLTIEFVKKQFEKENYILLTRVYKGNKQKLDYICPKGHKGSMSWNSWQRGKRCPYCANNVKLTIEFVRSEFEKEGYTLLTKVYENAHTRLHYICPKGHKYFITWNNWAHGRRCFYCCGTVRLSIEFIRSEFEKEGYILLTKVYKNNEQKLDYICPKGHKHPMTWGNWQQGHRCQHCSHRVSKWEKEVKSFLDKSNIDYMPNDRTQLVNPETGYSFELDLWFPKLNKAIECNGTYWHSLEKAVVRDKIKKQLCKEQGINLLVVPEKEWGIDIGKWQQNILNFLKEGTKLKQLEVFDGYKQSVQK